MNTKRIATVKATEARYLVQQIDFRTGRVHCWGEVVGYRGLSTRHAGAKAFALEDVTVAELPFDASTVRALFQQASKALGPRPSMDEVLAKALGPAPDSLLAIVAKAMA